MTAEISIEKQLLGLFDTISREFHSLSISYRAIEESCKKLNDSERDIRDTKLAVIEMTQSITSSKESWSRIDNTLQELLAYKNKLDDLPQKNIDLTYEIQTKLDNMLTIFDKEFIYGIKALKSYEQLHEDLKPVVRLSKLLTKPLGVLVFVVAFTLAISAASFGIYKIAQLFVPEQKIEQKNNTESLIAELRAELIEIKLHNSNTNHIE